MKKTLLFIILCLIMSSCMQKEVIPSNHTQNNSQSNIAEFNEESAKHELAEYLSIQNTDNMKIMKQDSSSYVIHITDNNLSKEKSGQQITEQNYTIMKNGNIIKHTVPENLIGTWSNNEHTRTYDIDENLITVSDSELGVYGETYDITDFEQF